MKPMWSLLPYDALREVVKVMTWGVQKHGGITWPERSKDLHFDALMRHLTSWRTGEILDPETGYSHLAHMGCRALMLLALEIREHRKNEQ